MKILFLPLSFLFSCDISNPSIDDLKEVDSMLSPKKSKLCHETFIDKNYVNLVPEHSICSDGSKPIKVYFLWETDSKVCRKDSQKRYIKKEFGCMKIFEIDRPQI